MNAFLLCVYLCVFLCDKCLEFEDLVMFVDAMGVVGSQDVKNMRIIISIFKPCTHGVMDDDKQLSQSIFECPCLIFGWQQSFTFPLIMFDEYWSRTE